jgi:hypothetical protein
MRGLEPFEHPPRLGKHDQRQADECADCQAPQERKLGAVECLADKEPAERRDDRPDHALER